MRHLGVGARFNHHRTRHSPDVVSKYKTHRIKEMHSVAAIIPRCTWTSKGVLSETLS
ncbi:hypothetical protein FOMPIDRAFT_1024056 [Fomitopsis schrenkii]|uniref:Uncharacterized protein n=1 Tax=Fomitopsis schrenkii TaxID=2126942 RepID=S8E4X0_FOMSC|nr:hypothetical protein FOMPIDRAFT_1024056 [Fomitopsis schrenkii]